MYFIYHIRKINFAFIIFLFYKNKCRTFCYPIDNNKLHETSIKSS